MGIVVAKVYRLQQVTLGTAYEFMANYVDKRWSMGNFFRIATKAESYFQHTESTVSSDTRQSMKRRIIAKHLTEPK